MAHRPTTIVLPPRSFSVMVCPARQSKNNDVEENSAVLGSLDTMLERARKRKVVRPMYKIQAAWDAPLMKLHPYPNMKTSLVVTGGDTALIIFSVAIHAYGFALGLIIAKVTAGPLRDLLRPPVLAQSIAMPLWPVLWAIGLDQIL